MIKKFGQFISEVKDGILFRNATNDDYSEIKRISNQHRNYLPFVMRVAIEESITRNEVVVAEDYGKVIGFIHFHKRKDGITTIHEVGVDKEYLNRGIGRKLILQLKKPIQLKVTKDNPANDFYKKIGFEFKKSIKGKKRDLNLYLLESIDNKIEIIEDCSLEFCDEYGLDAHVEKRTFS